MKILVVKNSNFVIISQNGKKLKIDACDSKYEFIFKMTIEEIEKWFTENKKIN